MNSRPTKSNILVVEDEDLLRWTVRRKLEDAGFMVLDAPSCGAAINIAATTRIDLLISDYRLEDGFGDDLARKLGSGSKRMGLILMTGEAEQLDSTNIAGVHLLRIFSKPIDLDELAALTASWTPADVDGSEGESRVGTFRIFRIESAEDVTAVGDHNSDDIALEIRGDMGGVSESELCDAIKLLNVSGRRLCVVSSLTGAVAQACRLAGIEVVADRVDLQVLSRRLLSGSERNAVLSVAVLRDQ